jgi:hypothetical protein
VQKHKHVDTQQWRQRLRYMVHINATVHLCL